MTDPDNQRVPLELRIASELMPILRDTPVGAEFTVEPSADICCALELFLPQMLSRRFPEWEKESLDGIFVAHASKTSPLGVQFVGTCILISDQTVTPFLVDIVLTPPGDSIASLRVCIGEPGGGRLGISGPGCNSREAKQLLAMITRRLNDGRWVYSIASDTASSLGLW